MFPKKLDVYITKKFMLTFFIAILLIIGIVIIFDISEKIDDFVAKQAPLKEIIFSYPVFHEHVQPSVRVHNGHILHIQNGGQLGNHRHPLLRNQFPPDDAAIYFLRIRYRAAVVGPEPFRHTAGQCREARLRGGIYEEESIHYQIAPGQFVYVEQFSKYNNTAYKFTLETIENNQLVSKVSAERAVWDASIGGWTLKKYFIREYNEAGLEDKVRCGEQLDTVISLTVDDFFRKKNTVEDLPFEQLNELISVQKLRGDPNVKYSLIEKHTRFSLPFSAFILTIMGVALSSRKKRGGIGWNLAIGIALSFSYILFMRFSQMFVYTGLMPPWLAIWLPNMIFAVIAGVLYRIAPK